jgi:hypothetical protein
MSSFAWMAKLPLGGRQQLFFEVQLSKRSVCKEGVESRRWDFKKEFASLRLMAVPTAGILPRVGRAGLAGVTSNISFSALRLTTSASTRSSSAA